MFRRSGGFVAFHVEGKTPRPDQEAFAEALSLQRFRSIETAASEERSIGWVSPADPTGDSFAQEDLDLDGAVWLRIRIDKKKLPTIWLKIHRAEAERSRGTPMSARERKELRVDLERRLLPRILPSVQLVDVLWSVEKDLILLFATSSSMREEFHKLFLRTFGARLIDSDPHSLAVHAGISREAVAYLDEVAPVRWPRSKEEGVDVHERRHAGVIAQDDIEVHDDHDDHGAEIDA